MLGTQQEERQALTTELEALTKLEQIIPATVKLGRRICAIVDAYAVEVARGVSEIEFGDTTWHPDGKFYVPLQLKDQFSLVSYKPPAKPWHEFSSLKVLDQQGFEQVCSLLFAIGQQLLPIVKYSGSIRPDQIQFEKPRVVVSGSVKQIVFKATFKDRGGSRQKLGDSGHIPK